MKQYVPIKILKIFEIYKNGVYSACNNVSMEDSATIASFPYIHFKLLGAPTANSDLQGDECAVNLTFQIEIFTNGQKSLEKAYQIDEVSHGIMVGLFLCRRIYGPEVIQNVDNKIKRMVSRYSRILGGGDSL